ncbi:hypothetical protein EDC04DRAFT_2608483 [Pisolithus marmoratus]|nr:hypothetical protein EDC04DRAFT_2608483 [Pisolithus marmoratus]
MAIHVFISSTTQDDVGLPWSAVQVWNGPKETLDHCWQMSGDVIFVDLLKNWMNTCAAGRCYHTPKSSSTKIPLYLLASSLPMEQHIIATTVIMTFPHGSEHQALHIDFWVMEGNAVADDVSKTDNEDKLPPIAVVHSCKRINGVPKGVLAVDAAWDLVEHEFILQF